MCAVSIRVDAEAHRLAQQLAGGLGAGLAPHAGQPHGAETQPVHLQLASDGEGSGRTGGPGHLWRGGGHGQRGYDLKHG